MGLAALSSLPSRGAFTAEEIEPTQNKTVVLRPYVSAASVSSLNEKQRVRTDGTNILIRQLQQSRARAEARKRAQRTQAALEAEARSAAHVEEARRREKEQREALERAAGKQTAPVDSEEPSTSKRNERAKSDSQRADQGGVNPFARKRGGASGSNANDGREAKRGKSTR
jgi:hypothetical protein